MQTLQRLTHLVHVISTNGSGAGCQFDTLDFDLVVEGLHFNPHVLKLVIPGIYSQTWSLPVRGVRSSPPGLTLKLGVCLPGSIPETGLRYLADMLEENTALTTVKLTGLFYLCLCLQDLQYAGPSLYLSQVVAPSGEYILFTPFL